MSFTKKVCFFSLKPVAIAFVATLSILTLNGYGPATEPLQLYTAKLEGQNMLVKGV